MKGVLANATVNYDTKTMYHFEPEMHNNTSWKNRFQKQSFVDFSF